MQIDLETWTRAGIFLFLTIGQLFTGIARADRFYQPDDPATQVVDARELAEAVLKFETRAKTTAEHYRENAQDRRACTETFKLLAKDASFLNVMRLKDGPDEEDWKTLVQSEKYKNNNRLQTIERFPTRFALYFSFYRRQTSVANIGGFHCDVATMVRAIVAERLGADKFSFALRRQVLEKFTGNLDYPADGMGSGFSFGQLHRYLQQSYQVYSEPTQKRWVDKQVKIAIARIQKEVNKGAPTYRPEDIEELDAWIGKLRALLI